MWSIGYASAAFCYKWRIAVTLIRSPPSIFFPISMPQTDRNFLIRLSSHTALSAPESRGIVRREGVTISRCGRGGNVDFATVPVKPVRNACGVSR